MSCRDSEQRRIAQRDDGIASDGVEELRARIVDAAKEWADWRMGYGGVQVHETEDRLFDAVLALLECVTRKDRAKRDALLEKDLAPEEAERLAWPAAPGQGRHVP